MDESTRPTDSHSSRWFSMRTTIARYETAFWMVAVVALLAYRWPVVKGYYYKATDAVAPPTAIAWTTDVDAALAVARRDGRRVVVDFTASWCPPCIAMSHDVWPDPRVARAVLDGFVPVLIDTDRDGRTPARYGVEGIPTVIVLNADGTTMKRGAPLTAGAMLDFLSSSR